MSFVMKHNIQSFSALIDTFGGPHIFAECVGIKTSLARQMKRRDKINPRHWHNVVAASKKKDIKLSEADLTRLYSQQTEPLSG